MIAAAMPAGCLVRILRARKKLAFHSTQSLSRGAFRLIYTALRSPYLGLAVALAAWIPAAYVGPRCANDNGHLYLILYLGQLGLDDFPGVGSKF